MQLLLRQLLDTISAATDGALRAERVERFMLHLLAAIFVHFVAVSATVHTL